ncbi:MAG: HigA family addiction module antidote protein [Synergistaceae bacterium]|nr:HigA family addiction module antidote protein [Synergistaceae bacterium]MBQ6434556.1 HigA family addiction module antidote protein [Synergistaceae bacterium]MBR0075258.1 HigA family addiction module antidote protein [Synergistaceae bacterium]MBR0078777.1 HigA family addiction module antidote protein [Synergistaceae bacterium]MBR0234409.1 HigA family addiction module antidote protein [Synergistaceae bacterium]
MVANKHGISPDLLIHPGETISDILEERKITQKELAQRAGVSEPFLSDVIHGKKDISKKLASGLEYALGVPSSFWLNLQANYDSEFLSLHEEDTIQAEERNIYKSIKSDVVIPDNLTQDQIIIWLRRHFRVSSLVCLQELAERT